MIKNQNSYSTIASIVFVALAIGCFVGGFAFFTQADNESITVGDGGTLNIYNGGGNLGGTTNYDDLVVTSMLRGKKVMHLFEDPSFEYLPGETVIVPSNAEMKIDFPEASKDNPTQCIALAIDNNIITNTLDFLNEKYTKEGKSNLWKLDHENYFFYNNVELAGTINKLIKECMGNSITKDAIADLTLQELIIRIIQMIVS